MSTRRSTPRLGRQQAQVRGFIDRVSIPALAPEFVSLRALATMTGLSVKTLRAYLALPADQALPHYRLPGGGKVIVRLDDWRHWIERHRTLGAPDLARTLRELGLPA